MHRNQLIDIHEVARRLKIHPETVRRFLRSGILKGARVGKVWRVAEQDLADYLESRSNRP